jgi:hypothetical protein
MMNPPGANYTSFGVSDDQPGNLQSYVRLSSYAPYDATHMVLEFFRPGAGGSTVIPTTFVLDRLEHSYAVALDLGGTWHVLVDGLEVLATIDISNVTGGNRCWAGYSQSGTDLAIGELIYGYQRPTLLAAPDTFSVRQQQRIALVGDSVFQGIPDPSYAAMIPFELSVQQKFSVANALLPTFTNYAVGGDTTADMLGHQAAVIAGNPAHIIYLCGLNDFFNHGGAPIPPGPGAGSTYDNYTNFINGVAAALPNCKHHVGSNIWSGSEQRPRGAGANDGLVDATNAAIAAAVAAQPAGRARYLDFIPRIYTSFSPVLNPGNGATGFMTQLGDGYHPFKVAGQNVISMCFFDLFTWSL